MGKYFGTDGFRGEAGITLTADHAYKVGHFLGWYYNALRERNGNNEPARIVIGKDTRRSSYMFEYSLVAGLTASGADAYLLHVTTTPSVAYIARVDDFDCGIMISASHNPYYDNGIKLIDRYGEKMPEKILLLVEDYIDGKLHVFDKDWPELPFAHREHIGCTVDYVAGRNRYMGYLISLGIYSFKGVKVGLDCANGSSWNIAKSVFDALGADTYVINAQPNGLNINNNAGSTHIEGLQKFVVEKGLDVGFAYDGDADRCLCVDEKGNVITGDHILYIYGCYMKERGKLLTNTVVTTVMSNFGLYKAFDEQGMDNRRMAEEITRLVDACHGHALVLFTSYRQMAEVRALTDGQWTYPTYQAWRNGGKIIQQFKQSGNGVLFAAGSCWEGIDFPGDMVSLLIIAKLPFPIPDPVSNYERRQYPNLRDYINAEIIPEMQKKLRQGFGRAIRTEQDSCVVAILDERAGIGGKYHDAALAALPTCPITEKIEDVQQFIREQKRPDYFL